MPKKIPDDDKAAIQLMVDLLSTGFSAKFREVAREAATRLKLPGALKAHEERLRKKYRRLRTDDLLPAHQTRMDQNRAAIRRVFADREATRENIRVLLAAKEQDAAELGLDISGDEEALSTLVRTLEQEMHMLEMYTRSSGHTIGSLLLDLAKSAEEADAKYLAMEERFGQLRRMVEVVRAVRDLRMGLAPITRVFPQRPNPIGKIRSLAGEKEATPGEIPSNDREE